MKAHAIVTEAHADVTPTAWATSFNQLYPGAHVVVMCNGIRPEVVSLGLRAAGFEFRDTLMAQTGEAGRRFIPCLLFRKPIEEKTVAHQITLTGTGAINIDATRVKHSSEADFEAHKAQVEAVKAKGGVRDGSWKNSSDLSGANDVKEGGRWPGNVVLVHAPGCVRIGETKMKAPVINRFDDGAKPFGNGAGHAYTSVQTGDENGEEAVAVYDCASGCPVGDLDTQSGVTRSGAMRYEVAAYEGSSSTPFLRGRSGPSNQHGDSGGASRFFSQFECVSECPSNQLDRQSGELRTNPGTITSNMAAMGYNGGAGSVREVRADSGGASRFYTRVDRLSLRDWLTTLVLPQGGVLLDPLQASESDGASPTA